jgi:competence protein ComEC
VVVSSIGDHTGNYEAINMKVDSTEVSSREAFLSKKARLLSFNLDTIRQLYAPRPPHPRR